MNEKSEEAANARQPIEPTATKTRKPYEKPTARKLTLEQAKLKLLGAASMGDQGAMELLEILFSETRKDSISNLRDPKDSKADKKSA